MDDGVTAAFFEQSEGVGDWRVVGDGACAFFATPSFASSVELVRAIAGLVGVEAHPPDVDIRLTGVTVRLVTVTDDWYGLSRRDVALAQRISEVARGMGIVADPSSVQSVLVIPGAPAPAEVMPFWQAALDYVRRPDSPDEDLVDPRGRGPAVWLESMDEPRPGGTGAVHVAVWVPAEQAEARVAAALGAGGRMVRDAFAPSWWTLADAAGNEVDIASVTGRE